MSRGSTQDPRILVVGATGMLGRPVAERLAEDGLRVRVLSRDPGRARQALGGRFEYAAGDVRDEGSVFRAMRDCTGVHINLRGVTAADAETVEASGTATICRAAAKAAIQRLTYLSGAGIQSAPADLLPVRIKRAAEAAVRSSAVPYAILRATHFMESLDLFVRGGTAAVLGNQPNRYHYLAAADYARRLSALYRSPDKGDHELSLFGPEPFTMLEALTLYARVAHPGLKVRTVPLAIPKLVSRVTRNAELAMVVSLFDAFRKIPETGDGSKADRLLGASTTTLEQWCMQRAHNLR